MDGDSNCVFSSPSWRVLSLHTLTPTACGTPVAQYALLPQCALFEGLFGWAEKLGGAEVGAEKPIEYERFVSKILD